MTVKVLPNGEVMRNDWTKEELYPPTEFEKGCNARALFMLCLLALLGIGALVRFVWAWVT